MYKSPMKQSTVSIKSLHRILLLYNRFRFHYYFNTLDKTQFFLISSTHPSLFRVPLFKYLVLLLSLDTIILNALEKVRKIVEWYKHKNVFRHIIISVLLSQRMNVHLTAKVIAILKM